MLHHKVLLQLSAGVGGGGARGQAHLQKF